MRLFEINQPTKRLYKSGMCDAMAIALHNITSLPIGVFRGYYYDDDFDEEAYQDCHAVVIVNRDIPEWIDVDGIHVGFPKNCVLPQKSRLVLETITVDEAMFLFTMDGVAEHDIVTATKFIMDDPTLNTIIKRFCNEDK